MEREPTQETRGTGAPEGDDARRGPARLPAGRLGWVFPRSGATAFGGLGVALALIERDLVDDRRALTRAEVAEALTYTKLLPGSTVVQVVSYLGYRLGGWPGSALATAAFVLPSALTMTLLAALYTAAFALPTLGPAVTGLTAAVVGLLLATTYRLGRANLSGPLTAAIAVAAVVIGAALGVNAAVIVVAAELVGLFLLSRAPTGPGTARGAESGVTMGGG